jgi:arginine deiminase
MIFTMVDRDKCVVFPPLITGPQRSRAFIAIRQRQPGTHCRILRRDRGIAGAGIDLTPIACGGADEFHQEREQWASGANFFAFGPGQILGYAHNQNTRLKHWPGRVQRGAAGDHCW